MLFYLAGEEGEKPEGETAAEEGETAEKPEGEEGSKSPVPQVNRGLTPTYPLPNLFKKPPFRIVVYCILIKLKLGLLSFYLSWFLLMILTE